MTIAQLIGKRAPLRARARWERACDPMTWIKSTLGSTVSRPNAQAPGASRCGRGAMFRRAHHLLAAGIALVALGVHGTAAACSGIDVLGTLSDKTLGVVQVYVYLPGGSNSCPPLASIPVPAGHYSVEIELPIGPQIQEVDVRAGEEVTVIFESKGLRSIRRAQR